MDKYCILNNECINPLALERLFLPYDPSGPKGLKGF